MTTTRVFTWLDWVFAERRNRVQHVGAEPGYAPNSAAGGPATRRSGFVRLLLPTLTNGNFAKLAEGLTQLPRPAGYELLVGYTRYSMQEEQHQLRTMPARRPEAVILATLACRASVRHLLARAGVPVVGVADLLEAPIGHMAGFSNRAMGVAAAEFLIRLCHTRIAASSDARTTDRRDLPSEARLLGVAQALRAAGLPTNLNRRDVVIPLSFAEGARIMGLLLDDAPDVQVVFTVSSLAAVGAMTERGRRQIAIPDR